MLCGLLLANGCLYLKNSIESAFDSCLEIVPPCRDTSPGQVAVDDPTVDSKTFSFDGRHSSSLIRRLLACMIISRGKTHRHCKQAPI